MSQFLALLIMDGVASFEHSVQMFGAVGSVVAVVVVEVDVVVVVIVDVVVVVAQPPSSNSHGCPHLSMAIITSPDGQPIAGTENIG